MRTGYRLGGVETHGFRFIDSNGKAIIEGDIVLGRSDDLRLFAGLSQPSIVISPDSHGQQWPAGVIPYQISSNLPNPQRVLQAIQHWQSKTPIQLVERTSQQDYVIFQPSPDQCDSRVGRVGGAQAIELADGCAFGQVVHEIGHSVGLWHEQSRLDRNGFVTVHYENVIPGEANRIQFDQEPIEGFDFGPYDYDSIMHYGAYDFSANGQPTIVPTDSAISLNRLGQRNGLSPGDIRGVNFLYKTLGTYWQSIAGKAREISIGAAGSVYVVGTSRQPDARGFDVYEFNGAGWNVVPSIAAVKIAVASDGTLWHVNELGDIYRGRTAIPGRAREIGAGADGSIYVVGTSHPGTHGFDVYKFNGTGWNVVPNIAAIKIAIARDGTIWHVNDLGDVYHGTQAKSNRMSEIAVGADGSVYSISNIGRPTGGDAHGFVVYRWVENSLYVLRGTAATRIAVDPQGRPWHLNDINDIYRRQ